MTIAENRYVKARRKLKLNQREFWAPLRVTQSGGSRYETGRDVPEPVEVLFDIRYGNNNEKRRALASLGVKLPKNSRRHVGLEVA